ELHRTVNRVVHDRLALAGSLQPKRVRLRRRHVRITTRAGISEGFPALLGDLTECLQCLGAAATAIRGPLGQQSLGMRAIDLGALGLPVAWSRRPLVPGEAEPAHRIDDDADVLFRRARTVGVLDAENEHAPVMAGEQPVEQSGPSAADVEMAGGARSEAYADRAGHRGLFYSDPAGRRREAQNFRPRTTKWGRERMTSTTQRQTPGT